MDARMGQPNSTPNGENLLLQLGGYNFGMQHFDADEEIARRLQDEEYGHDANDLSGFLDERELQMARDAELAYYMDANGGELPQYLNEAQAVPAAGAHEERVHCVACDEEKTLREVVQAPCGDHYCGECLGRLFRQSMTDEQYFPPRCHREEIQLADARRIIEPDLARQFEARYVELSTVDRTYCSDVSRGQFIPPNTIQNDVATCRFCARRTCSMCKAGSHEGDCPRDAALQQVVETARQQGWSRCQRCSRMIELSHGCNHMTCLCGHEFCYVCGRAPWKTCRCPAFDQRRLLHQAGEIVNQGRDIQNEQDQQRDNAPKGVQRQPVVANQGHRARVNLVAQQLVNNHNGCQHPVPWSRYQHGEHECWVCHRRKGNRQVGWCRRCYFVSCYNCRRRANNRAR